MSFLWSLGSFIVAIAVLVAVHEYGHFWAARKCGIKVHRFSIGFGKVIWRRTDKLGTEFAISAIPLGGYVKMLDGRNEEVPAELKSQAFESKSVAQRAFVISAGPLANFIFAILAYWVIYSVGIPSVKPVIENVMSNSPAAIAQIEPNTQILAIDGKNTPDWETINLLLTDKLGSDSVELTLTPFGEDQPYQRTINLQNWTFEPDKETAFETLGINPVSSKVEMTLSKVVENSPAEKAGQISWFIVKAIGKLFSGELSFSSLAGPISIAQGAGASSNAGVIYFLSFLALISVNLGIMNLFPLPVLDGGHLVFLAAEAIKGKPVSERVQNLSYRIGLTILLIQTIFVLFNDFLRL